MNIKTDSRNYRIHGDKNKALINKSLSECGAGRSILIDKDDVIIAGNGVYEQAQALGLKIRVIESDGSELIAVKRTDLTTEDERRKLLAVADNKTSDMSVFDFDLLSVDFQLDELVDWGFEADEFNTEEIAYPVELTSEKKDKPPVIKITFSDVKQMERFEQELKPLIEKYGVSYVVGGGEL